MTMKQKYVKIPAGAYLRACAIIGEFRDILKKNIQEERGLLLMSSGYENLDAVLGILGQAQWPSGTAPEPPLPVLSVSNQDSRDALKTAYSLVDAAVPNAMDGSAAQQACMQLEAALFSILNMSSAPEPEAVQRALSDAATAARFGLELASGIADAGGLPEDQWMNPGATVLDPDRLEKVAGIFRMFIPGGTGPAPEAEGGAGS